MQLLQFSNSRTEDLIVVFTGIEDCVYPSYNKICLPFQLLDGRDMTLLLLHPISRHFTVLHNHIIIQLKLFIGTRSWNHLIMRTHLQLHLILGILVESKYVLLHLHLQSPLLGTIIGSTNTVDLHLTHTITFICLLQAGQGLQSLHISLPFLHQ